MIEQQFSRKVKQNKKKQRKYLVWLAEKETIASSLTKKKAIQLNGSN